MVGATSQVTVADSKETTTTTTALVSSSSSSASTTPPVWPAWYPTNLKNPIETRAFLASDLQDSIEKAVKELCDELRDDSPNWELFYEKTNYVAKRKVGAEMVYLKVESEIPFSLLDAAVLLVDGKRQKELDGAVVVFEDLKHFSNQTLINYCQYAAVRRSELNINILMLLFCFLFVCYLWCLSIVFVVSS